MVLLAVYLKCNFDIRRVSFVNSNPDIFIYCVLVLLRKSIRFNVTYVFFVSLNRTLPFLKFDRYYNSSCSIKVSSLRSLYRFCLLSVWLHNKRSNSVILWLNYFLNNNDPANLLECRYLQCIDRFKMQCNHRQVYYAACQVIYKLFSTVTASSNVLHFYFRES